MLISLTVCSRALTIGALDTWIRPDSLARVDERNDTSGSRKVPSSDAALDDGDGRSATIATPFGNLALVVGGAGRAATSVPARCGRNERRDASGSRKVPSSDAALDDGDGRSATIATIFNDLVSWVWPFAISKIHKRPIFGTRHQFLAHRIFQDVIYFLPTAFIMAQTVFKKIGLPGNAGFLRRPFLPFADNKADGFVRRGKRQQCVQVIRHQQENIGPPDKFLLPVADSFKQFFGRVFKSQLIAKTFHTVDGDKIDFPMRIYPKRNHVW